MTGAPPLPVVLRAALLLGAAAALVFALTRGGQLPARAGAYACPMHPSVVSSRPGTCPLCGMALVPGRLEPPPRTAAPSERVQRRIALRAARAPAWVDTDGTPVARVDAEDLPEFRGRDAAFHRADAPDRVMVVRAPPTLEPEPGAASQEVRFSWVHRSGVPPAGTVGWIERPEDRRALLVVPAASVLHGPGGDSVLLLGPEGRLARRSIQVGRTALGFSTVLSGLAEGERVVGAEAFFLDAELRRNEAEPAPRPGR